jgi:transposase
MVEEMRNNPSAFPAIEKKIDKLVQTQRSQLMKADGIDLKDYTKKQGKEAADALKQGYTDRINRSAFLEQTIEYYSSPGSFRIVRRMGKTYIQFSAEMPSTSTPSNKAIGVDTGLDLLIDASNGLRVRYQEFEAREKRLVNLNKRISKCVVGSNRWKKLNEKRRSISRKLAKAKAGRPTFYASQIADVNRSIAVRKLKLKESIATPEPRPDGKGGYLPNDAGVIAEQNKLIHSRAIGKFVLLLQQQARKHDRQFAIVEIESEATAAEILEVSELPIVESPKANPLISPCDAPEPVAFVKRDRKRERRIG